MSELRAFAGDEAFRISLFRNIAIVDVAGPIDEARMRKMEEAFLRLHSDFGEVGVLGVMRGTAPIPGADARSYASHIVKAHGEWLKLVAMVVEDSGLVMQLFISLVRSINFIAGRSRINVFPHLTAAEEALIEQLFPWTERAKMLSEFRAAVREARAQFATFSPGSAA